MFFSVYIEVNLDEGRGVWDGDIEAGAGLMGLHAV